MKKKIIIAVLSFLTVLCGVLGVGLLPTTPKAMAIEVKPVYTLAFNGAESASAITGASKSVEIADGQTVSLELTVNKTLSVEPGFSSHSAGWTFYFYVASCDGATWSSKASIMTRSAGGYVGKWFCGSTEIVTPGITASSLFVEGNQIKVTYKPYASETDKGHIKVFLKDTFVDGSEYQEVISCDTLSAAQAPKNAAIYLASGWKMQMDVTDYTVKTSDGVDLGAGYANGAMRVAEVGTDPDPIYNAKFTETSSYFGSKNGVNLTDGETLVMEYDVYSSNLTDENFEMGFSIASGHSGFNTGNRVEIDSSSVVSFRGNAVAISNDGVNGYVTGTGVNGATFTGVLNPQALFSAGRSVKVVYSPYISDAQKGSITVYTKSADAVDSEYQEIAKVIDIPKEAAPSEDVYIFTEMFKNRTWMIPKEFLVQIYNYSVYTEQNSSVTETINGFATNVNASIEKVKKVDKTVVEHTYHNYESGYFGNAMAFKKTSGKEFAMEFSVLDIDMGSGNCWIGFAFGASMSTNFYTSGTLFYFNTAPRITGEENVINSYDPRCEAKWVFAAGYRIKGVLNVENNTFSVYKKVIGDKEYGSPVAVFTTNDTIPAYFHLGMCFQNKVYMEMADLRFSVDGVNREFAVSGNKYTQTDLETTSITDRVAILTANKTADGLGSLTYVYDNALTTEHEVSFELLKGHDLSLKFASDDKCSSVNATLSLKDYTEYSTYKFQANGSNIFLYGKRAGTDEFTQLTQAECSLNEYYFAFYIENDSVNAKNSFIDDLIISRAGNETIYDFNRGLTDDFTAISVGRSKASVNFDGFTITYYFADGTIASVQTVGYGGNAVIPEIENASIVNVDYVTEKSTFITSDTSILIVRSTDDLDYYVVTVKNGTFTDGTDIALAKGSSTLSVTAPAPQTGYKFDGWFDDNSILSTDRTYDFTVTKTVELVAKYSIIRVAVTVVDGRVDGDNTSVVVDYGTIVTILANDAPNKKVFSGWFDGETLISDQKSYSFTAIKDMNLTAKYIPQTFTVTVVNGKVDGKPQAVVDVDSAVTVTANEPSNGYIFSHWQINGVIVGENETYVIDCVDDDVTVSAVYVLKTYTITVTGGTVNEQKDVYEHGEVIVITANDKQGFKFDGWYVGETKVSSDKVYEHTVTDDINLVAKYTENIAPTNSGCGGNIEGSANILSVVLLFAALIISRKAKGGKKS